MIPRKAPAFRKRKGTVPPSSPSLLAGYPGPVRDDGLAAVIYTDKCVIPCEMMATYTGYLHAYGEL